jgi:Resolvase, N terminal domain
MPPANTAIVSSSKRCSALRRGGSSTFCSFGVWTGLSREGVVETLNHLQRLTGYGVDYRSFTEQYLDSTGLFKEAVIGILAAIAKQERVRLSERTIAGLERARAHCRVGGRPKVEDSPGIVKEFRKLKASGAVCAPDRVPNGNFTHQCPEAR